MDNYLRMAQRLNNLNNFRYRSNPNLDGLEEAIKFLDNSPALTDWTTPAKCAVSRCLDAAKLYLKKDGELKMLEKPMIEFKVLEITALLKNLQVRK